MAVLPPVGFEVSFVVVAEMRWAMRAKSVIEDWLLSDAAGERPVDQLPSADLEMALDHSELKLNWLELEAASAWQAVQRAAAVVEEMLPELLRARTLRVDARMQATDPDLRRPQGT